MKSICRSIALAIGVLACLAPSAAAEPTELAAHAEGGLALLTKIFGVGVKFSCEEVSLDKALLELEGKASGTVLFGGCKTLLNGSANLACEPKAGGTKPGVIASKALKGLLTLHESPAATLARVTAVEGQTLATVEMGEECAIGTKVPVIGTLYVKDATGEFEVEKEARLLGEGPLTELWAISKTAEHKVTLDGNASFTLTGKSLGGKWSGLGSKPEWMITPKPHEFTSSPEGSGFMGQGGTQTFTLGGHAISCESAKISGHATKELLSMGVNYETCEAFSTSANVPEADYSLNANGMGGIAAETQATITVKPSAEAECVYTLPETSKPVASVSFANNEAGITISATLKELAYELEEKGTTICGTNGEKSAEGEYKGEVTTESYEEARCIFWGLGGFRFDPWCAIEGAGLWELRSGYKTLKWS